jgi:hypothetical protein
VSIFGTARERVARGVEYLDSQPVGNPAYPWWEGPNVLRRRLDMSTVRHAGAGPIFGGFIHAPLTEVEAMVFGLLWADGDGPGDLEAEWYRVADARRAGGTS